MSRRWWFLVVPAAVVLTHGVVACVVGGPDETNLNPQPLPPADGEESPGQGTDDGKNGGATGSSSGGGLPSSASDGGVSRGDADADAPSDASDQ